MAARLLVPKADLRFRSEMKETANGGGPLSSQSFGWRRMPC